MYKGKNFNKEKKETPKKYDGPIRGSNVYLQLPLDYGLSKSEKAKALFLFRDESGRTKMKYNRYLGVFALNDEDKHQSFKKVSSNRFIISEIDGKIYFHVSIIEDGQITQGGNLTFLTNDLIVINPINTFDRRSSGYKYTPISEWEVIGDHEVEFYKEKNYEVAFLVNNIVEKEMLSLNSSFYQSYIGIDALDSYINNIYEMYKSWKENKKVKFSCYEEIEYTIDKFLRTPLIESMILESRNNFNKIFAKYRLEELLCIVDHNKFLSLNQDYLYFSNEVFEDYYNLLSLNERYQNYLAINAAIENNEDVDFDKDEFNEMKDIVDNNSKVFLKKMSKLSDYNENIGYDIFLKRYKLNIILKYYKENVGILYPSKDTDSFITKETEKYILNQYKEEYNHYAFLLKDINYKKAQKSLLKYYSSRSVEALNSLNKIKTEINSIISKQKDLLTNMDIGMDPILYYKVDYLTDDSQKYKNIETIENDEFTINSKRLQILESLYLNHPDNTYFNGNITPSRFQFYEIEIDGEDGYPGFIIESNVHIPNLLIERGKCLFGINDNWESIKEDKETTIKDKYYFYSIFNDIVKLKKELEDLEVEASSRQKEMIKEQKVFNKQIDNKDKKQMLKKIAHSNSFFNLINQRIDFLNKLIDMQKVEMTGFLSDKFNKNIRSLFPDAEEFISSYIETYKRYRIIGKTIRDVRYDIENKKLKNEKYPSDENKADIKASQKALREAKNKHKVLCMYLAEKDNNLEDKIHDIKNALLDENLDKVSNILSKISKAESEILNIKILKHKVFLASNAVVIEDIVDEQLVLKNNINELSILEAVEDILSVEHVSSLYIYNKVEHLNVLLKKSNDEDEKRYLSEMLDMYTNRLDELDLLINDLNLYSVNAFDQGQIHQHLRNIIDKNNSLGFEDTYKLLDEIICEYKYKVNKDVNIEKLVDKYNKENNSNILITSFTVKDCEIIVDYTKELIARINKYIKELIDINELLNLNISKEDAIKELKMLSKDINLLLEEDILIQFKDMDSENLQLEIKSLIEKLKDLRSEYITCGNSLNYTGLNYESKPVVNLTIKDIKDKIKLESVEQLVVSLKHPERLKPLPEKKHSKGLMINDNKKYYAVINGKKVAIDNTKKEEVPHTNITVAEILKEI